MQAIWQWAINSPGPLNRTVRRAMKRFTITHLLLVTTWSAIAFVYLHRHFATIPYTGNPRDLSEAMIFHSGFEGDVITEFDATDLAATPSWHPADENPPLNAKAALRIADRYQREHLVDSEEHGDWGLESLTLHPLDAAAGRWCWSVLYSQYPHYKFSGRPADFSFYILMNGKVVVAEPYRMENHDEGSDNKE